MPEIFYFELYTGKSHQQNMPNIIIIIDKLKAICHIPSKVSTFLIVFSQYEFTLYTRGMEN